MVRISIPVLLVITIQLFYSPTKENPLVVITRGKCGPNDTLCTKAAIVKGQTSIGLPAVCYLKVDPGPCGRDLFRVYYDSRTARCKHFSYSGCGGNANRFISIKNCYHICSPGYRTRVIGTLPAVETTTACPVLPKRKVKLNVTSVEQIEVEM